MKKLIEAGHYYATKGITVYSHIGKKICEKLKNSEDKTMLFIDDVHGFDSMFKQEMEAELVTWKDVYDETPQAKEDDEDFGLMNGTRPMPIEKLHEQGFDFIVNESSLIRDIKSITELLAGKIKTSRSGKYFRGIKLFHENDFPTCVMLDACLTLEKRNVYGFEHIINILPEFYLPQQKNLKEVISRIFPEVKLDVILFTSEENYRYL